MINEMVERQDNILTTQETQSTMLAEQAKALVQARYMVAISRPRDMFDVQQRLEKECKRPTFAEHAIYKKPIGKSTITGLSIRFAESAIRLYGNISVESMVVFETEQKRQIKIIVCDIETNAVYSQDIIIDKTIERLDSNGREVVSSRTNSYGKVLFIVKATEDELQIKQAAFTSKAIRNLALRLIPVDILENCQTLCLATINDANAKDPDTAKKKIVDSFANIGIQAAELSKYLGHTIDTIKPNEITDLRTIWQTIKDGETTWRAIMETRNIGDGITAKKDTPKDLKEIIQQKIDDGGIKKGE